MQMPWFLIVVHSDGVIGSWQRVPVNGWVHVDEFTSSAAPSVTRNSTSCGVSPALLARRRGSASVC